MKESFEDSLKRIVLRTGSAVLRDVEVGFDEGLAVKIVRFENSSHVMVYVLERYEEGDRGWHVQPEAGLAVPVEKVDAFVTAMRRAEGTGGQLVERAASLSQPIERVLEAFAEGVITKSRARELIEAGIVWGSKDIDLNLPRGDVMEKEGRLFPGATIVCAGASSDAGEFFDVCNRLTSDVCNRLTSDLCEVSPFSSVSCVFGTHGCEAMRGWSVMGEP